MKHLTLPRTFAVLASLILASALSSKADPVNAQASYTDHGTSSIKVSKNADGRTVYSITTTSYEIAHLYGGDSPMPILLKKVTENVQTEGLEGSRGKISVEARGNGQHTFDRVLYKIKENAHDGAFTDEDLYLTWKYGCCDSATSYHAFDIRTGKLILAYDDHTGPDAQTKSPFVIEVPNTSLKRFVGILTQNATRDFKPGETADHLTKIATLTYSSIGGPIQSFDVFGTVPANSAIFVGAHIVDTTGLGQNELRQNHLMLWTSDGQNNPALAFHGFAIKLTFSSETTSEMIVPFVSDRADLAGLQAPPGFRILPAN